MGCILPAYPLESWGREKEQEFLCPKEDRGRKGRGEHAVEFLSLESEPWRRYEESRGKRTLSVNVRQCATSKTSKGQQPRRGQRLKATSRITRSTFRFFRFILERFQLLNPENLILERVDFKNYVERVVLTEDLLVLRNRETLLVTWNTNSGIEDKLECRTEDLMPWWCWWRQLFSQLL